MKTDRAVDLRGMPKAAPAAAAPLGGPGQEGFRLLMNTVVWTSCRTASQDRPLKFSKIQPALDQAVIGFNAPAVVVEFPKFRRGIKGFVQEVGGQHLHSPVASRTVTSRRVRVAQGQARVADGRPFLGEWLQRDHQRCARPGRRQRVD